MLDNISVKAKIVNLPIMRNINIFADLKALFFLILIFQKNKFSLVHSVSPKAGLLCAISALLTCVPNRIHTFTGQVWATKKGFSRYTLKLFDKLIVVLNTNILVDSYSQQKFLISENILSNCASFVLGSGSISGVDTIRFSPSLSQSKIIRDSLHIDNSNVVLLFLGRLKREKGVIKLAHAFKEVINKNKNVTLLIVGQDEDDLKKELLMSFNLCMDFVKFIDFTKNPEDYMNAADILILPSYREGFGNVVIESACCGIPSIVSNVYGLNDSIIDGETGLVTSDNSIKSLQDAIVTLVTNKNLRLKMGENALARGVEFFSQEILTLELINFYKRLLK